MALQLQMTWQPHVKKRKNGVPLGLKNLGNTCYLNSVLQCLTYTPPLANFCLKLQHTAFCDSAAQQENKKSECPFCLLEKRIVRSLSVDQNLDTPTKIINSLKNFAEHFRFGRQEDAHEFLRYVIDACHTTCLRLKKLQQQPRKFVSSNGGGEGFSGSTVVKEIFGGALQSQVKCLTCGIESNKVDEIMDISIDVLNIGSLKEAFQKFFQPEILDGNNKYKCENCKKLVAARKQMSILQAPNILVIQLKRFEGIFGGKIDKAIAFEEVLVLSSFMCKGSQDPHPEYNLFATIVHSGFSPDSGHYYAYIKDAIGRWYCCNDSYVSLSTLQEVVSEKVYILFFSRTKQRHVPTNKTLSTNGTKSYTCNEGDASKILKSSHVLKSVDSQQYADHHSQKDKTTTSKVDKVPTSPHKKLISSGNFATRKVPTNDNGKVIVHNKEVNGKNGDVQASIGKVISEKKMPLLEHRNGFSESKNADTINGERSPPLSLAKGNGEIQRNGADLVADGCECNGTRNGMAVGSGPSCQQVQNGCVKSNPNKSGTKRKLQEEESCSLFAEDSQSRAKREELKEAYATPYLLCKNADTINGERSQPLSLAKGNGEIQRNGADLVADGCERNGTRNGMAVGSGPSYQQVQNGCVKSNPDKSGTKRKLQEEESCTLFAEDSQSRAKREELKEALGKEASLVLRTCGWSDEVYNFMRSKMLCAPETGDDASNSNDFKRLLIADAKSKFISRIPESLKASFIKRLISFSKEQHLDP